MKPADPTDDKGFSLRRWSQRKLAARATPREYGGRDAATQTRGAPASEAAVTDAAANAMAAPNGSADVAPPAQPAHAHAPSARPRETDSPLRADPARAASSLPPASALPSLDSLSIESDFSAFMQSGVDESLKRGALKKLFSDPRFNVMDGLDVYIDDYSKPDPLDPAIVRTLAQARYIFNPPATRVTAEGYVEDIPEEELRAARDVASESATEPDVAGHDTAAALPGVQPVAGQDTAAALPGVQPQDNAMPAPKAEPDAA